MHLGCAPWNRGIANPDRRRFLKGTAGGLAALSLAGPGALFLPADAPAHEGHDEFERGKFLNGKGPKDFETGQEWIRTFFESATKIVDFYADEFVFEDISLFQTIDDKKELYAAFAPFENKDPDSPIGVHWFDVIRYDGGPVKKMRPQMRKERSADFTEAEYAEATKNIFKGDFDYDEFAVMHWIWKAKHNADFLDWPAAGKTTICRGITFHCYKKRRIVREFTYWNTRGVQIQLGLYPKASEFWKTPAGV